MPYLVAGVVLVGVLCAFDLILTLAVVRRLREHAALLEGGRTPVPFTPVGTTLPEFTARIQDLDARRVLAVIEGEQDEAEPFTAALAPIATVVVEPVNGPVNTAFGHPASPSFHVVGDGAVVTSSTLSPAGLPVPARA